MEPLGRPAVEGMGDGQSQGLGLARPRQGFPRGCPQPALTQDQRAAPQGGSGKRSVGSGWTTRGAASRHGFASPLLRFLSVSSPRFWSGAGAQTASLGSLPGTAGSCRRPLALAASPAGLAAARGRLLQRCISRRVLLN